MQLSNILLSSVLGLAALASAIPAPSMQEVAPAMDAPLETRDFDEGFEDRQALFVRSVLEELLADPDFEY